MEKDFFSKTYAECEEGYSKANYPVQDTVDDDEVDYDDDDEVEEDDDEVGEDIVGHVERGP